MLPLLCLKDETETVNKCHMAMGTHKNEKKRKKKKHHINSSVICLNLYSAIRNNNNLYKKLFVSTVYKVKRENPDMYKDCEERKAA